MNTEQIISNLIGLRQENMAKLDEIRGTVAARQSDVLNEGDHGDGSSMDADAGATLFERDRQLAFEQEYSAVIAAIDAAVARATSGGYGVCEICGKPIGAERLQAIPYAVRCIRCQELEDGS